MPLSFAQRLKSFFQAEAVDEVVVEPVNDRVMNNSIAIRGLMPSENEVDIGRALEKALYHEAPPSIIQRLKHYRR